MAQAITKSIIISTRENGTRRVQYQFEGQGRTHQEGKEDADINNIVARWKRSGIPPRMNPGRPLYADFSGPTDYQDQVDAVRAADDAYMALPAETRDLSDNDPRLFLEMMQSPEGREALAATGLDLGEARPEENAPSEAPERAPQASEGSPAPQEPSDSEVPS